MVNAKTYPVLGELIRNGRGAVGIEDQRKLADLVGASQQSVSRWEAGIARPRLRQIARLAKALAVEDSKLRNAAGYGTPDEALPDTTTVSFDQNMPVDALSPESFERFVDHLLRKRFPDAEIRIAGASGHDQNGVDIVATFPDGHTESFQCKRVRRFGPADVGTVVSADSTDAKRKHLVLSRIASPATAAAVRRHRDWALWDKADLSRMVRDLAIVDQVRLVDIFFPGQRFSLLGIPNAGPWQTVEEFFAPFEARSATFRHNWPLVGRKELAESIVDRLLGGTGTIFILEGRGGEGKSRLLKEITSKIALDPTECRVVFLSPSESPTADSLEQLGGGRKILVVDDAHERTDLDAVFAYVADPARNARLLLATRPYATARLRGTASTFALSDSIKRIAIQPLSLDEARSLAAEVLQESGGSANLAEPIAKATRDCPLVTVVAARIAATENIPLAFVQSKDQFRDTILGKFAKIISGQHAGNEQKQTAEILQVIALVQPFSIEDEQFQRLVTSVTGIADHVVSTTLRNLVDGGVIFRRGAQFRLMPDVLGDYIIEQSCVGYGDKLNSLANKVFESAPHPLLGHVLVNLGRLDWRRAGGDPNKSHLLDHLWRALRADRGGSGAVTEAVCSAAYYQPLQALEFVKAELDSAAPSRELPKILERVAYHFELLDQVCELLWEMGRNDAREMGPNPGHAMRVLSELCAVEPDKPIFYNERVVSFGLQLLKEPANFDYHSTPFTFLRSIVQGDGQIITGTARGITVGRFPVPYDVVARLRTQVVGAAIEILTSENLRAAVLAADFLQNALHYPMDAREELRAKYAAEFSSTLERLKMLIDTGALNPVVVIAIVRSICWHASFGAGGPRKLANEIMDALPQDLEFRTLAALADGWGQVFIDRGDVNTWQTRLDDWIAKLTVEISNAHPNAADLLAFLEWTLDQIVNSALAKSDSTHVLTHQIIQKREDLAKEIVERAPENPDAFITRELGMALGMMLRSDPKSARIWARRLMDIGHVPFQISVAQAYTNPPVTEAGLNPDDFEILIRVLRSSNARVVLTGSGALYQLARKSPRLAIDMLRHVNFQAHGDVVDRVFMLFHADESTVLATLAADDVTYILGELIHLQCLEGYWLDRLLSYFSKRFPVETMKFLMARVEVASKDDTFGVMRAVNHRPWAKVRMRFQESDDVKVLMEMTWAWIIDHDTSDWRFEYNAAALFESMFMPVNEAVVEFLSSKLRGARRQELWWIATILGNAEQRFVFAHSEFAITFMDQCDRIGHPARRKAIQSLFRSAISGVRSGFVGEPTQYDLDNSRRAKEILARLPRQSGAHELYSHVLKDADSSIEQARQDAEFFDDE